MRIQAGRFLDTRQVNHKTKGESPKMGAEIILRILIYGIALSGCNALVAIGFNLIFGVAKILNMAHGQFFILGGYLCYALVTSVFTQFPPSVSLAISGVIAIPLSFFIGIVVYAALRPVENNMLSVLIVSAAEGSFITTVLYMIYGAYVRSLPTLIPGTVKVLGVEVASQYLLQTGISFFMMLLLVAFLYKTKTGKAIRATADDREAAMLMGINTAKINAVTFGIAAALCTLTAMLTCSVPFIMEPLWAPGTWMNRSFVIAVLGGLGSITGTVLAALIYSFVGIALMELSPTWFPGLGAYLVDIVMPIAVLIILYLRPTGLLGRPLRELLWEES